MLSHCCCRWRECRWFRFASLSSSISCNWDTCNTNWKFDVAFFSGTLSRSLPIVHELESCSSNIVCAPVSVVLFSEPWDCCGAGWSGLLQGWVLAVVKRLENMVRATKHKRINNLLEKSEIISKFLLLKLHSTSLLRWPLSLTLVWNAPLDF